MFKIGSIIYVSPPIGSPFSFTLKKIVNVGGSDLLYGREVYAVHPRYCKSDGKSVKTEENTENKPIVSDGKSSSYYDLKLSQKTIDFIIENGYVKTEHLIYDMFDNDFDAGNAFKSLVRAWGTINGSGKQGNSLQYELNKIEYSINKIREYRGKE